MKRLVLAVVLAATAASASAYAGPKKSDFATDFFQQLQLNGN